MEESDGDREITKANAQMAMLEVMRKWDIDLSEDEESKIKNEVFGPEWKNMVGPSDSITVNQSVEFMNSILNIIKGDNT